MDDMIGVFCIFSAKIRFFCESAKEKAGNSDVQSNFKAMAAHASASAKA